MPISTVPVTITYRNQISTPPPVFLAGSWTDPPWLLHEMQSVPEGGSQSVYQALIHVQPGLEYQFKFKLGDGDLWVLDEDTEVGTDHAGNKNNLIRVPLAVGEAGPVLSELSTIPRRLPDNLDVSDETTGWSTPISTGLVARKTAAKIEDAAQESVLVGIATLL